MSSMLLVLDSLLRVCAPLNGRVAPGLGGRRVPAGRERLCSRRGRGAGARGGSWRLCRLAVGLAQWIVAAKGGRGVREWGKKGERERRASDAQGHDLSGWRGPLLFCARPGAVHGSTCAGARERERGWSSASSRPWSSGSAPLHVSTATRARLCSARPTRRLLHAAYTKHQRRTTHLHPSRLPGPPHLISPPSPTSSLKRAGSPCKMSPSSSSKPTPRQTGLATRAIHQDSPLSGPEVAPSISCVPSRPLNSTHDASRRL